MLHLTWAVALSIDSAAGNATSIHTLLNFVSSDAAIVIYSSAAVLAISGFFQRGIREALFLLPQQFIMMISAGGALQAMWLGQFADGVQRSHAFLITDQVPAVIAAILHTYAIIRIAKDNE